MSGGGTCEVTLGDWDGDEAQFYDESFITARRQHKCYECDEPILKGEEYERVKGRWNDEWSTYRFCLACSEATRALSENGRTFGILWDTMTDAWEDGARISACLNRLTTAVSKRKMLQRWRQWKRLA